VGTVTRWYDPRNFIYFVAQHVIEKPKGLGIAA
jgi:hypothetical protein